MYEHTFRGDGVLRQGSAELPVKYEFCQFLLNNSIRSEGRIEGPASIQIGPGVLRLLGGEEVPVAIGSGIAGKHELFVNSAYVDGKFS